MKRYIVAGLVLAGIVLLAQAVSQENPEGRLVRFKEAAAAVAGQVAGLGKETAVADAEAAVLMDASTGRLLVAQNEAAPLPPASMSKMMTEYLVLEQLQRGKLQWEEKVKISSYAAAAAGSGITLKAGDLLSVRDLFAAVSIHSANDAAIALAERVAGSEEAFSKLMNRKAKDMGLSKNARFINATGLPRSDMGDHAPASIRGEQTMTAADTARLARRLLSDHPEILDFSNRTVYKLDYRGIPLTNTNVMLQATESLYPSLYVKGMDGLKTGYTTEAGYCFTGTAVVDGKRYISVVMGASGSMKRFEETKKLFAYGVQGGGDRP